MAVTGKEKHTSASTMVDAKPDRKRFYPIHTRNFHDVLPTFAKRRVSFLIVSFFYRIFRKQGLSWLKWREKCRQLFLSSALGHFLLRKNRSEISYLGETKQIRYGKSKINAHLISRDKTFVLYRANPKFDWILFAEVAYGSHGPS